MRRTALLVPLFAAGLALANTASASAATATSTFSATAGSASTGVTLLANETAIVTATVSSDYNICNNGGCGTGDLGNGGSAETNGFDAYSANTGGVPMVGGTVFVFGVGAATPIAGGITVTGPGTISIGINDFDGYMSDNRGTVTWTVTTVETPPVLVVKDTHGEFVSGATKAGIKGKALAAIAKRVELVGPYDPAKV